MNSHKRKIVLSLLAVQQGNQILANLGTSGATLAAIHDFIEDNENSTDAKKRKLQFERDSQLFMKNYGPFLMSPELPTVRGNIADFVRDPSRNYMKHLTAFTAHEFLVLADQLKDLIEAPRTAEVVHREGDKCKDDHYTRLFWALAWLQSGDKYIKKEALSGIPKTTGYRDLRHVLRAIVVGLEGQIQWPTAAERYAIAHETTGVFEGCVGVLDVMESFIRRPMDAEVQHSTISCKYKRCTRKTLVVIDKDGLFTFVSHGGGGRTSDRELFTTSPLYMQRNDYFSLNEWVGGDGIFRGDGNVRTSFNNITADGVLALYNLVFREGRMPVENALGRTQANFAVLGAQRKYFTGNSELLSLAVHAATRLHNWLLRNRQLVYNAHLHPDVVNRALH